MRTAPGQRSATVELRVGEGWLGTGIGERWKALPPVQAEWVDEPGRRRYIAIDPRGLDAALRAHGIAMARPPQDSDDDDDDDDHRRGRKSRRDWRDGGTPPPPMGDNNPPPGPLPMGVPVPPQDDNDRAERERIRDSAARIATGHAYWDHVEIRREFPRISNQRQFAEFLERIMLRVRNTKDDYKYLPNSGQRAYWDKETRTLIIEDPSNPDGGTAYKPHNGRKAFDDLKDR